MAVRRMGAPHGSFLATLGDAFQGVFANRFQHGKTWLGTSAIRALNEVLIHQGAKALKEVDTEIVAGVAHCFRRL